jgi:hypothetical protein
VEKGMGFIFEFGADIITTAVFEFGVDVITTAV